MKVSQAKGTISSDRAIREARNLIVYGEVVTQLQKDLERYVDSGELSVPRESLYLAYKEGWKISDISEQDAGYIYDAIGEHGDAVRDNSIKDLISIGKGNNP